MIRGILAALCVVILSVTFYYIFVREDSDAQPKIAKAKQRIADVGTSVVHSVEAPVVTNVVDKSKPHPAYLKKNSNSRLPPKRYIPSIEEVEAAHLGPDGKPKRVAIYKSGLEQTLSVIFSTELGSMPPMLPSIPSQVTPEQIEKFLNTPFEYDKDASKRVNENRILLENVKKEFKKYIDDGGDPKRFVGYYYDELKVAHDEWKTARDMVVNMSRNGDDPKLVREFRDRANKLLDERGIKPVVLPRSVRIHIGDENP